MEKDFAAGVSYKPGETAKKKGSKEKELVRPRTSKKKVLFLLLGSVLVSWYLWKQPQIKNWWQSLLEPATYEIVNPGVVDEQLIRISKNLHTSDDVLAGIEELTGPLQGIYGVYVEPLNGGESYGLNQDQEYTAASVNKVFIIAKFLQAAEAGQVSLELSYALKAKDIQDYGTGSIRYAPVGTKYSYERLLELSGKQSDNTAAWVLTAILGETEIQALIDTTGLKQTSFKENLTTPAETGRFLSLIYQGEILQTDTKAKFYSYLTRTDFEERIPAGLPDFVPVAHKIGTEIQTVNDCGLVFDKKHPYALCILSKGVKEDEALEVLPKISNLVWSFESHRR